MASLLDGVDKLFSDVLGPLLFQDAEIQSEGAATIDGDGQSVHALTPAPITALLVDYEAFARAQGGIPTNHRKIMVMGYDMETPPKPGDRIIYSAYPWVVVATTRDPAKAVYECQCKPGKSENG